jgi:hypothetical protein
VTSDTAIKCAASPPCYLGITAVILVLPPENDWVLGNKDKEINAFKFASPTN